MLRRHLLASVASLGLVSTLARAAELRGDGAPPSERALEPPTPVLAGPWQFFTADEGRAVEAIVDRLIPADELSIGGREAGCAVFIDRQLAGPFGRAATLYMRPPFMPGTPQQGPQTPNTPADQYRAALAALDTHCRGRFVGRGFADLAAAQQDQVVTDLEAGRIELGQVSGRGFFGLILTNTREGFFADPIYGGNRGMVSWKMIGFPGARYDYRAEIRRPGAVLDLPPVGLVGDPA